MFKWKEVPASESAAFKLINGVPQLATVRAARVDFYKAAVALVRLDDEGHLSYIAMTPDASARLGGTGSPLHWLNDKMTLQLTPWNALDYLTFFAFFVESDGDRFTLIHRPEHLPAYAQGMFFRPAMATIVSGDSVLSYHFKAAVCHQRNLFRAAFTVTPDGQVTMTDDEPLMPLPTMRLRPIDLPEI